MLFQAMLVYGDDIKDVVMPKTCGHAHKTVELARKCGVELQDKVWAEEKVGWSRIKVIVVDKRGDPI